MTEIATAVLRMNNSSSLCFEDVLSWSLCKDAVFMLFDINVPIIHPEDCNVESAQSSSGCRFWVPFSAFLSLQLPVEAQD